MDTPSELHIVLGFDERFWAPAYATMRSICLTTHRREDLRFHLCHPPIRAGFLADLDRITEEFGARLIHHDVEAVESYRHFAQTLPHTRYISAVAFARMLLGEIIAPDIHRILYIDCDILVRAPIEELLAADLKGRPVGAARDPHSIVFSNGRDVRQNRDLLDPADPYFNSGLLLIDLDQWRRLDIGAILRDLEARGELIRLKSDQQILNRVFRGNWTELDPSWNTFGVSPAIEVLHPRAVHYTGLQKPWNLVTFLPFSRAYRHVMTNDLFYRFRRQRRTWWWRDLWVRLSGRGKR